MAKDADDREAAAHRSEQGCGNAAARRVLVQEVSRWVDRPLRRSSQYE